MLTIDYILLECAVLKESRDEYYTADSWNTLFETIPETGILYNSSLNHPKMDAVLLLQLAPDLDNSIRLDKFG